MSVIPVRILPMDSETEFDGRSVNEVQQQFFLNDLPLPSRTGRYCYRSSGLNAERGTIVLFQYTSKIIACATLDRVERFEVAEGPYEGALYFDVGSIKVFNPVGPDVVAGIWPEFNGFSHVKWTLDPKGFAEFERKMTDVETPKL
ncbi:MAG: hypothetical protein EXS05_07480 [Planctomycetaceae bacterium]|nr:hypothetical protein [Planctomycetaceae bacterium]